MADLWFLLLVVSTVSIVGVKLAFQIRELPESLPDSHKRRGITTEQFQTEMVEYVKEYEKAMAEWHSLTTIKKKWKKMPLDPTEKIKKDYYGTILIAKVRVKDVTDNDVWVMVNSKKNLFPNGIRADFNSRWKPVLAKLDIQQNVVVSGRLEELWVGRTVSTSGRELRREGDSFVFDDHETSYDSSKCRLSSCAIALNVD